MTNRKLAKIILDYIPHWELPYTKDKDNYDMILTNIKKEPRELYNYIYNEDECGTTFNLIIKELKRRIK